MLGLADVLLAPHGGPSGRGVRVVAFGGLVQQNGAPPPLVDAGLVLWMDLVLGGLEAPVLCCDEKELVLVEVLLGSGELVCNQLVSS